MKPYVERKVTFTDDGRMLDEDGKSIMMDWEKPIMKFQAEQICRRGGDILNIGYGMGFMDYEIERFNPTSHTIIEIHPDVHNRIIQEGWHKKKHVNLLFGDWKKYLHDLPKFDGMYFDTWDDSDLKLLVENLKTLLKPNGVMTFFNNPKDDTDSLGYPYFIKPEVEKNLKVEFEDLSLDFIDTPLRQTGSDVSCYWSPFWKVYRSPILSLR